MNKDFIFLFFVATGLLMGALKYSDKFYHIFTSSLNGVKTAYWDVYDSVEHTIDEHFNQKDTINRLLVENRALQKESLTLIDESNRFKEINLETKSQLHGGLNIELVRTVSYVRFGDLNKVWIKMSNFNPSKVYGLTQNGNSAGIVVEKNGAPMALLNYDRKSSYAVTIGEDKSPGIASGRNQPEMVVKYIPTWKKIKIDDEVVTSGLDKIFPIGIKVGKVVKIEQAQGYQKAYILPYAKSSEMGYMHLIRIED